MLRFRLGRIPVEVHFTHFVVAGLIAWQFIESNIDPDLARRIGLPALVLAGVAVVFVSILVHELGHALVSLAYGYQPTVQLAWLGGNTRPNARAPIPWHRDLFLTLAGPVFGLLLGLACNFAVPHVRSANTLAFALFFSTFVNLYWSVLNLVPIAPLDGGRIAMLLLTRAFGRRGFFIAQGIGAAIGLGLGFWFLKGGEQLGGFLFAVFGVQALGTLMSALKRPRVDPSDPAAKGLRALTELFHAGRFDEARQLGLSLLDRDPPAAAPIRAHVHHALGWIAVKEGQGRRALDHFSQVHGVPVEPQALAAAFSLVGDDVRALPLWEFAFQNTGDRTVLHEWGGTLVRLGRSEDAARLPGVDLAAAYECAERVLFLRERYSEAAEAAQKRVALRPTADAAYDAACAFARAGNRERAVELLNRARELGFSDVDYAGKDPDLASLHGHPAFERWRTAESAQP